MRVERVARCTAPLGLAWAGVRHRAGAWLLLTVGVAVAVALPVLAAGLRAESSVAAVVATVDALPPAERTVLAVTSADLRGSAFAAADRSVRAGLAESRVADPAQSLTFRPLSVGGTDVTLGAVDRLPDRVRLVSGSLPRSCTPTRCEVLAVQAPGSDLKIDPADTARPTRALGLVVTGNADLVDDRLVGTGVTSSTLPLLLGADPTALSGLSSLQLFGRTVAWYGTLDGHAVADQGPATFGRALAQLSEQVNLTGAGPLSVSWPSDAISAAATRATASAQRFSVLGAGAGALQLGFTFVVAAGMRRRQQLVGLLLGRRGGTTAQVVLTAVLQAVIAALAGLLLGAVIAASVVAARARLGALDVAGSTSQAVWSSLPVLTALTVLAVVGVAAVGTWPATGGRAARWLTAFVLVAAGGLVAHALSGTTTRSGPSTATGLLPTLAGVAFVVGVGLATTLAWPLLVAVRGRARRGTLVSVGRSTAIVARRRPLVGMITAGFLAAACCLLVFTGGYRESLQQSAADQAALRVPLDAAITASSRVAVPLSVLDPAKLHGAAPGATVRPVVTAAVRAFAGTSLAQSFPLTGVDPVALTEMHQFAATTGAGVPAAELARRLADPQAAQHTPVIPAGARRIGLVATGDTAEVVVGLWVSTAEGEQQQIALTARGDRLTADLEPGPARTVQALEIAENESVELHRQHGVGEGTTDRSRTTGTLRLGSVTVDGSELPWSWTGWGSGQLTAGSPAADRIVLPYRIGDARVIITPGYVAPGRRPVLPVAVDPATAAKVGPTGRFGLLVDNQTVPAQVVATLPRFPGAGSSFVLADRSAVVTLLDRSAPGTAAVSQVWIAAPGADLTAVRQILGSAPANTATVVFRSDLERVIVDDPVATRSILLLTWAGGIALLLAMVAAAAAVRADVEESRVDQIALELDGVTPTGLRRRLLTRAGMVAAVGVPLGVVGGVVLTVLGVRLLVTGPGGAAVLPPLRPVLGTASLLGVVLAAVLGVSLSSAAAALGALREPRPRITRTDLR